MTHLEQQETLRRANPLICEAHSLLLDVYLAREQAGELIEGDALTKALSFLGQAIRTLRDSGESRDYDAAWERPPNKPPP
jgi:hypothetical protein